MTQRAAVSPSAVDLFAGPGGLDVACAALGIRVVGIEIDRHACATRAAAGHRTIRADVSVYPTEPFVGRIDGLIASPPCPSFSSAGKRQGIRDLPRLYAHVAACRAGWVDYSRDGWHDLRSSLVLEVLRWAWQTRPRWIACEQVREVLLLWRAMASVLRGWGYDADARLLNAANYGVPQTRVRAFLIARRDANVRWPEPTHARRPHPLLDGRKPWISMAEALGWGMTERPMLTLAVGHGSAMCLGSANSRAAVTHEQKQGRWRALHTSRGQHEHGRRQVVSADRPAPALTAKSGGQWRLSVGANTNATERHADEPAPTLFFGHQAAKVRWVTERPATTICNCNVVAAPGYRTTVSRQDAEGSVKITLAEAAVVQGFPPDYPFRGARRFEQVGNAVPPPLAEAVLRALTA